MALQCPSCEERLDVKRTYSAGSAGQSQETECPKCGKRFAAVTMLLREVNSWGMGAFAAIHLLKAGILKLRIDKSRLTDRKR